MPRQHKILHGRFILRNLFHEGGFWKARVRDTTTGKLTKVGTREKNRAKAERAVISWIEEQLRRENQTAALEVMFGATFEEWISLKSLSPSTARDYKSSCSGVFLPSFGDKLLGEITGKDVERFIKNLETKRHSSARTRRKHLTMLRSFFTWAVRHGHVAVDPTSGIKVPRGAKRQGVALSFDEAQRLLRTCREPILQEVRDWRRRPWQQSWRPPEHLGLAVLLAMETGLRRGNVIDLTWGQVDLGKRKITIPAEEMKAHADHEVPVHPELAEVLAGLLRKRDRVPQAEDLVLGTKIAGITTSFKSALKRAGLPQIRWHDLRHTFATWMSSRTSFSGLRQLLGHSPGGAVTLHYTHVPFEELQAAVDSLPRLLDEQGEAASGAVPPRRRRSRRLPS